VQKGKELNDFQRNLLDIEILSNLRFGSLEIRDAEGKRTERFSEKSLNLENSLKSEVRFPSSKETLKLRR
jgi:hypothetical protein